MLPSMVSVEAPAEEFLELFAAARRAGLLLGWLDMTAPSDRPLDLDRAAAAGALRAVAAGKGVTVAVKHLRGEPVLADLVREHFTGCRLLLVRGAAIAAPILRRTDGEWSVRGGSRPRGPLTTDALVEALRKPGFP